MEASQHTLILLLIILFLGLVIPRATRAKRLPISALLILAGAILGPHALGLTAPNEVINFFAFLGFTFLMFMAGLETDLEAVRRSIRRIGVLTALNATVPFFVGVAIARVFDYSWPAALLLGALFVSSSVAVAVPAIRRLRGAKKSTKESMLGAVVIEDMLSLVLLAIIFQSVAPTTPLPLSLYFIILFLSVGFLVYALPLIARKMLVRRKRAVSNLEQTEPEVRFSLVVLIAVLVYFSAIGVHPILAAFLVGMLIAQSVPPEPLDKKFHVIGYGLFIPTFFFAAGMEMNLSALGALGGGALLTLVIVVGSILAKFSSGWIGGRLSGFTNKASRMFGLISTAQLTTTLAAAFTALQAGFIDTTLFTAVMVLSFTTTVAIPLIQSMLSFNKAGKE